MKRRGRIGRAVVALCAATWLAGGLPPAVHAGASAASAHASPLRAAGPVLARVRALVRGPSHPALGVSLPVLPVLPVPLSYGGGPVQVSGVTSYAIFWEPPGSYVSSTYHALVERYLADAGQSGIYGLVTQYYQGSGASQQHIVAGATAGGVYVDVQPFPETPLQDADVQAEVLHAMAVKGWTAGVDHQFLVLTPRGINSCMGGQCSFSTFCGYHGVFTSQGASVVYADMPYAGTSTSACGTPSSPNGDLDADSEINILSHEQMEMITDPDTSTGWVDLTGNEIGDKCDFVFGTQSANGADMVVNGHPYIVQEEYSNRAGLLLGACALS